MTDFNRAELRSLVAAVAGSPIVVRRAPAADFADWCGRQNASLDTVVLDWLREQSRTRKPVPLS